MKSQLIPIKCVNNIQKEVKGSDGDSFELNYTAAEWKRRSAVGFKFLFLNFNPLINFFINHVFYWRHKYWHSRWSNLYFHYWGLHYSHEYKSWLQFSYEDWLGYEFPIPLKVARITWQENFMVEKYKFDAHPFPNFITAEREEERIKSGSKDPRIDKEALPGTVMDYKYIDILDGWAKKEWQHWDKEGDPQHKMAGVKGYVPDMYRYSFLKSKMPQAWHLEYYPGRWFDYWYLKVNYYVYSNCGSRKCYGSFSVEPSGIYKPAANVYLRTFGTFKYKMKGLGMKVFDYNFRSVTGMTFYTVKRQDIVIKSKIVNKNSVPYCLFDSDYEVSSDKKQIYAAPCTTISSIGDGREHFYHLNSTGLFTGTNYRLVEKRGNYETFLYPGFQREYDKVNVYNHKQMTGILANMVNHGEYGLVYFQGDEYISSYNHMNYNHHSCLTLADAYGGGNYVNKSDVTSITANPLMQSPTNNPQVLLAEDLNNNQRAVSQAVYFADWVSASSMEITFRRDNFYYVRLYIKFKAAPVKIVVKCKFRGTETVVFSNFRNSSKLVDTDLLVVPCKQMHFEFNEFHKSISTFQNKMSHIVDDLQVYSDARSTYWGKCMKDNPPMMWYYSPYNPAPTTPFVSQVRNFSAKKQNFDKEMANFRLRFEQLRQNMNLSNVLRMQALSDANILMRNLSQIKFMNKKIRVIKTLFNSAAGGGGSSTFSGAQTGFLPDDPALSCEEIDSIYDNPASGYYYILSMCSKKSTKAFCDFSNRAEPKLYFLSNLDQEMNTWMEFSKYKVTDSKKILFTCARYGYYPFDILDVKELKTLAIVGKHFMIAYYTDGGIPIAFKTKDGMLSMSGSRNNTAAIQEFAGLIGTPLSPGPTHDTIFLKDAALTSAKMGEGTKTYAVPCTLEKASKIFRADCKYKIEDLDSSGNSEFLVQCTKACFNKVIGSGTYSKDSYICAAMMHSGQFIRSGKNRIATITGSSSVMKVFKGSTNKTYNVVSIGKTYQFGKDYFTVSKPSVKCPSAVYESLEEGSFLSKVMKVNIRNKVKSAIKFNSKANLSMNNKTQSTSKTSFKVKIKSKNKNKKLNLELNDNQGELNELEDIDKNLLKKEIEIDKSKIELVPTKELVDKKTSNIPKDNKTNSNKKSPEDIYPDNTHFFEPDIENPNHMKLTESHNDTVHYTKTNDWVITHYTPPENIQIQNEIKGYFDYIKSEFFMKSPGPNLPNKIYKPKLDISASLSKIWSLVNRYPNIMKKYDIFDLLFKEHVHNQLEKQMNQMDISQFDMLKNWIKYQFVNKGIEYFRKIKENKLEIKVKEQKSRINNIRKIEPFKETISDTKFSDNTISEEDVPSSNKYTINNDEEVESLLHLDIAEDSNLKEMRELITSRKTSTDYFTKYNKFKSLLFDESNNENSLYNSLRFSMTCEFSSDDMRSEKYYSEQQKKLIDNFNTLRFLNLEDSIEMAVSYVIRAHANDKMNMESELKQYDNNFQMLTNYLTEEQGLRTQSWIQKGDDVKKQAQGLPPALSAMNLMANNLKRLLKAQYESNYDKYMRMFKFFNYFYTASLIQNFEPPSRDFEAMDMASVADGPSKWMNTKKDVAPHPKALTQVSKVKRDGKSFATLLYTRYRVGFEFDLIASVKGVSGKVGIMWKYVDCYNFYAIELDYEGKQYVNLIYNNMNEIEYLHSSKFELDFNIWYKMIVSSHGNKMQIYFAEESMFEDKEWTAEDKKEFLSSNSPLMTVYHDALKSGKVGFYCNDCQGAFFDGIMLQHKDCVAAEDTAKMSLNSKFCDRYTEPLPGSKMKYIFSLKDESKATLKPFRWVISKGVEGRKKVIGQLAKVKLANLTLPASYFMKSKRKVMCKNMCIYELDFILHKTHGSITLGAKAHSFTRYIGLSFILKSEKKSTAVLFIYNKKIKVRFDKSNIKLIIGKWFKVRMMIFNNDVGVFMKPDGAEWRMLMYEKLSDEVVKMQGGVFVGTNNMLAHFDNLKTSRLFMNAEQENWMNAIMEATKGAREGDKQTKDSQYRFKTYNVDSDSDMSFSSDQFMKHIDSIDLVDPLDKIADQVEHQQQDFLNHLRFKSKDDDPYKKETKQEEQSKVNEEKSKENNKNTQETNSKEITEEPKIPTVYEAPNISLGIDNGLLRSYNDQLPSVYKLEADYCIRMQTLEQRVNFCHTYFEFNATECFKSFCPSCCRFTIAPSDYLNYLESCSSLCKRFDIKEDITDDIETCIRPRDELYNAYIPCPDNGFCKLAVCQTCCENITTYKFTNYDQIKLCNTKCRDEYLPKTEFSDMFKYWEFYDKTRNPMVTFESWNKQPTIQKFEK